MKARGDFRKKFQKENTDGFFIHLPTAGEKQVLNLHKCNLFSVEAVPDVVDFTEICPYLMK